MNKCTSCKKVDDAKLRYPEDFELNKDLFLSCTCRGFVERVDDYVLRKFKSERHLVRCKIG